MKSLLIFVAFKQLPTNVIQKKFSRHPAQLLKYSALWLIKKCYAIFFSPRLWSIDHLCSQWKILASAGYPLTTQHMDFLKHTARSTVAKNHNTHHQKVGRFGDLTTKLTRWIEHCATLEVHTAKASEIVNEFSCRNAADIVQVLRSKHLCLFVERTIAQWLFFTRWRSMIPIQ